MTIFMNCKVGHELSANKFKTGFHFVYYRHNAAICYSENLFFFNNSPSLNLRDSFILSLVKKYGKCS